MSKSGEPKWRKMAGPFDKQGQQYLDARPLYPPHLFKTIADLTPSHAVAWDAGTGNGQAAIGVAEYYEHVIATDISNGQLQHAIPHSRVRYLHAPASLSEDELVNSIGGDESVDLITVATAVHWFDLPKFYAVATRVLKKPDGVIVVWGYSHLITVNPKFEACMEKFRQPALQYWGSGIRYVFEEYRNLPFPFRSVGLGEEGKPWMMTMKRELSFERWLVVMRTCSAVMTAKECGVDLLPEDVVEGFAEAWGGPLDVVRDDVTSNVFLIAGKVK